MKKINFIILIIIITASFFLNGCNSGPILPASINMPIELPSETMQIQEQNDITKKDVGVYFDFTPSMQGFINESLPTKYMLSIPIIEEALMNSGMLNSDVITNYYKFGIKPIPISREEYLSVRSSNFYKLNENKENIKTQIDSVLKTANINNFLLIVTDLFEEEEDIVEVSKILIDKFLGNQKAFGIIGIRSEFNGIIYDLGIKDLRIKYVSGETDKNKFRPFYILMLGNPEDISNYYATFENLFSEQISKNSEINFLTVSPTFLNHFEVEKISTNKDLDPKSWEVKELVQKVTIDGFVKNVEAREFVSEFRIKSDKKASINVKTPYYINNRDNNIENEKLKFEIQSWDFEPKKGLPEKYSQEKTEKIYSIDLIDSEGSMDVGIYINSEYLQDDRLNLINLKIYLEEEKERSLPDWVSDWNMDIEQQLDIKSDLENKENIMVEENYQIYESPDFQGNKTLNLKRFLGILFDKDKREHKEQIAEYNFLFHKLLE